MKNLSYWVKCGEHWLNRRIEAKNADEREKADCAFLTCARRIAIMANVSQEAAEKYIERKWVNDPEY